LTFIDADTNRIIKAVIDHLGFAVGIYVGNFAIERMGNALATS
jgi:hypothetical protein